MERAIKTGKQAGLVYLLLLFVVALLGVGFAATGQVWQFEQRRAREQELLESGAQYRKAIQQYYQATPGVVKKYPPSLDDLLTDRRYPLPRHYLRQRYADPLTRQEWGMIKAPDGGWMGVYSQSELAPIRQQTEFGATAKSYRDWKFSYAPENAKPANPASPPPAN